MAGRGVVMRIYDNSVMMAFYITVIRWNEEDDIVLQEEWVFNRWEKDLAIQHLEHLRANFSDLGFNFETDVIRHNLDYDHRTDPTYNFT